MVNAFSSVLCMQAVYPVHAFLDLIAMVTSGDDYDDVRSAVLLKTLIFAQLGKQ
jgi:hypothetical protein